jgi:DNA-binding NarL/FixJ family response regulator
MEEIGRKIKFLIIEDSNYYLKETINTLNRYFQNCSVISAQSVEDAMAVFDLNRDIDILITDIELPNNSQTSLVENRGGIKIISEIRKFRHDIQIIAFSFFNEFELQPMLGELNVSYVKKYSGPQISLVSKITDLLQKR